MTIAIRAAAWAVLTVLACGGLIAGPISVTVAPRTTNSAGEPIYLTVTPHVEQGFTASVYLSVSSPTIPARLLLISPGLINPPYTDQGSIKVSFDAGILSGRHLIIVEGHNGPATSFDTAVVILQRTIPLNVFTMDNSPLPSNGVVNIAVDHNGIGWIATEGGLVTYDRTTWTDRSSDTTFRISYAYALGGTVVGSDNSLWMIGVDLHKSGLVTCLMRYINGAWTATYDERLQPSSGTAHLAADSSGNVWVASSSGLSKFDGTSWEVHPTASPAVVAVGRHDKVWVGAREGIPLRSFDGTYWTEFQPGFWQVAPQGEVRAVGVDRNNTVWMAGNRGISSMDTAGNVRTSYTSEGRFPGPDPWTFAFDQVGAMWVGDRVAGLTRYDGATETHYSKATMGLPSNYITCIAVGPDTTIWAGMYDGGFLIIDAKGFPKPASVAAGNRSMQARGIIQAVSPNPAREHASVEISVADRGHAVVSLFDGLGRRAIAPIERNVEPGTQALELPLDGLAAGVYLVSVELDGRVETSRLVVAR